MNLSNIYETSASLPLNAPSYVTRQADEQLYRELKGGRYCYVFNCRQMGKSSLRVQVTNRLRQEGVAVALIDPQKIGTKVRQDQWYAGVIKSLVQGFKLEPPFDFRQWWRSHDDPPISPVQRFGDFIEGVLLPRISQPIVIFVEEIDRLQSLEFSPDDFFLLIRRLCEDRSQNPELKRLTFALVGVTTPRELTQDRNHSGYKVGIDIEMEGFTLAEAAPLEAGLVGRVADPQTVLRAVLYWSGGQPFLTQKLLNLVVREVDIGQAPGADLIAWVAQIVQRRVIDNWEAQDFPEHLSTLQDRILHVDEKRRGELLGLYQRTLLGKDGIAADDSEEQAQLRLTGLVVKHQGRLRVYNPVYRAVFNQAWVERQLGELRPSFYIEALRAWHDSADSDAGYLLRGQALEEAEAWAEGKRLSDEDQRFLQTSRAYEKAESGKKLATAFSLVSVLTSKRYDKAENEKKLAAERQRNQLLAEANQSMEKARADAEQQSQLLAEAKTAADQQNQLLTRANQEAAVTIQNANQRLRMGGSILAATVLASVLTVGGSSAYSYLTNERSNFSLKVTQGEASFNKDVAKFYRENALYSNYFAGWLRQDANRKVSDANRRVSDAVRKTKDAMQLALDAELKTKDAMQRALDAELKTKATEEQARAAKQEQDDAQTKTNLHRQIARLERHSSEVSNQFQSRQTPGLLAAYRDVVTMQQIMEQAKGDLSFAAFGPMLTLQTSLHNIHETYLGSASQVVVSPKGNFIATVDNNGTVHLWNYQGNQVAEMQIPNYWGWNVGVIFSPDENYIATVGDEGTARLWDRQGKELSTIAGVISLVSDPKSDRIALISDNGLVRLLTWQQMAYFQTEVLRPREPGTLTDQSEPYTNDSGTKTYSKHYSLKGKAGEIIEVSLESQAFDTYVYLLDGQGKVLDNDGGSTNSRLVYQLPEDGTYQVVATTFNEGETGDYEIEVRVDQTSIGLAGSGGGVRQVAFSPDGQYIATVGYDGVRLWDHQGRPVDGQGNPVSPEQQIVLGGKENPISVRQVVFSPKGHYIATVGDDGTAHLWDRQGKPLNSIAGVTSLVSDLQSDSIALVFGNGLRLLTWEQMAQFQTEVLRPREPGTLTNQFEPYTNDFGAKTYAKRYPLEGKAGEIIEVSLESQAFDTYVYLLDGQGKVLAQNDDDGVSFNSGLLYRLPANGTYQIVATTLNEGEIGDYAIEVRVDRATATLLTDHEGVFRQVVFSPKGHYIATVGSDGKLQLWDEQGKLLPSVIGNQGRVNQVAFSPDGQHIATTAEDYARLWDITPLEGLEGQEDLLNQVVFSPKGNYIATVDRYGNAQLLNNQGKLVTKLTGNVQQIVFSPDENYIATVGDDGTARLWDRQGKELSTIAGVTSLVPDPESDRVALTSGNGLVRLLTWEQMAQFKTEVLRPRESGTLTNQSELYTNDSGAKTYAKPYPLEERKAGEIIEISLKSQAFDTYVYLLDAQGKVLAQNDDDGVSLNSRLLYRLPADGTYQIVATTLNEGEIGDYAIEVRVDQATATLLTDNEGAFRQVVFSPKGQYIATVGDDNAVRLWDHHGRPVDGQGNPVNPEQQLVLGGKEKPISVSQVVFSPDGSTIATVGDDGTTHLWDRQGRPVNGQGNPVNPEQQIVLGGKENPISVSQVVFSHDGHYIATVGDDNTVRLWDHQGRPVNGQGNPVKLAQQLVLRGYSGWLNRVTFSPDNQYIATEGVNATRIWALQQGQQIAQYDGLGALSPDWSEIALAVPNYGLQVWSVYTLENLENLENLDDLLRASCQRLRPYISSTITNPEDKQSLLRWCSTGE